MKQIHTYLLSSFFLGASLVGSLPTSLVAQEQRLVSEGIAGYADAKNRAPVLTVSVERTDGGGVKLLADAYIIYPELREFPVKFEFYVNRQLFATQYRSPGLEGPVGVDIGPDVGTPPFNFSVISSIVHPNRIFSSAVEGAVYAANLSTTFTSCTLTQSSGTDENPVESLFVAQNVATSQLQNETIELSFRGEPESAGDDVFVSATITVTGETAKGTLTTSAEGATSAKEGDADATTVNISGTATVNENKLTELELSSDDDSVSLSCS